MSEIIGIFLNFFLLKNINLGGVHKLRLQDLSFFDHLPPSVYIFYGIKVYKKSIFLTTYSPSLVNVICECPQAEDFRIFEFERWVKDFMSNKVTDIV